MRHGPLRRDIEKRKLVFERKSYWKILGFAGSKWPALRNYTRDSSLWKSHEKDKTEELSARQINNDGMLGAMNNDLN